MNPTLEQLLREMPELTCGKGLWQNKFHEFDVYEHTLKYVEFLKEMTSDPTMIVAGYFHDIGKPVVKKLKMSDGVPEEKSPGAPYHEFHDHERVGEEMVRKMDPKIFIDYSLDQERVAKLVGSHFLPLWHIKKMREAKNYNEFIEKYRELGRALDLTGLPQEDVMTMFLADTLAKGSNCPDIEELKLAREAIINNTPELPRALYSIQAKMYGGKE